MDSHTNAGGMIPRRSIRRTPGDGVGSRLAMPERDTTPGEIVGRKLNHDTVARKHTNVVLAHPATQMAQHLVAVLELNLEHGVRERLEDAPLDSNGIRVGATRPL
jgi:hypothetical protein